MRIKRAMRDRLRTFAHEGARGYCRCMCSHHRIMSGIDHRSREDLGIVQIHVRHATGPIPNQMVRQIRQRRGCCARGNPQAGSTVDEMLRQGVLRFIQ